MLSNVLLFQSHHTFESRWKRLIIIPDWQRNQLYVLLISLIALLMKLVMDQSGLILSDLLRLVSMGMGGIGPR